MVEGTEAPIPRAVDVKRIVDGDSGRVLGSFAYGTPDTVASRVLTHVAGLPIDTVFFWASVGGMPADMVRRGVEVICGDLAARLRAVPIHDSLHPHGPE